MSLSADQILTATDCTPEKVNVPEWGGDIYLLPLSATAGEKWATSNSKRVPRKGGGWDEIPQIVEGKARLLVQAITDEGGNRLFGDDKVTDLSKKNGAVINRLFEKAIELSGLKDEAAEAMEGESEAVPSDGSPSTSPENSDSPTPDIS